MKSGLLNQEFAMTATFSHVDDIIFNDITFKNQLTYLGLPQMKAYYDITISFRFKTMEMNGKFFVPNSCFTFDFHLWYLFQSKVNSVQEACAECFAVHILKFEIFQIT